MSRPDWITGSFSQLVPFCNVGHHPYGSLRCGARYSLGPVGLPPSVVTHSTSLMRIGSTKVRLTLKGSFLVLLFWMIQCSLYSQEQWPQRSSQLVQGCYQDVKGKSLDYLQNLTPPNVALVMEASSPRVSFRSESWQNIDFSDSLSLIIGVSVVGRHGGAAPFFSLIVDGIGAWESIDWNELQSNPISLSHGTLYFIEAWHPEVALGHYGYLMLNVPWHLLPESEVLQFEVQLEQRPNEDAAIYFYQDSLSMNLKAWALPAIKKSQSDRLVQPLRVEWTHLGPPREVFIFLDAQLLGTKTARPGVQVFDCEIPPVEQDTIATLALVIEGQEIATSVLNMRRVREVEVHLLPHSHVDIGFTHRQEEVMQMQWVGFKEAILQAERTKSYPYEARFKWNVEVLWAVEQFMREADPIDKAAFVKAVKEGAIGLDALFAGMLTGIQSGEEMMHNTDPAHWWRDQYQIDIRSAMVTDIPGAQWAFVPTLYHNGVRYLSMGPNHMPHMPDLGYQVGHTIKTWGDKPFYWESISGKERILVWMSRHGYSWFHPWLLGSIDKKEGVPILKFLSELEDEAYPYDMVQIRYTLGDNAGPDGSLSDFVKDWNETYLSPKLIINTTEAMFEQFESRYGDQLPIIRGDFTPYWEDGVASSALETGINRQTAEQIVQAEIVLSALPIHLFPLDIWSAAWKHVLLFSEHTWGSYSSKSDPDGQLALDQWAVKQSFALKAKQLADILLGDWKLESLPFSSEVTEFEVLNTQPFKVSDRILISDLKDPRAFRIVDESGSPVKTQVVSDGSLWVSIDTLMPYSSRKYSILSEPKDKETTTSMPSTYELDCGSIIMVWNDEGELLSMKDRKNDRQWIDPSDSIGFNRFWYSGVDTVGWQGASCRSISWIDKGQCLDQIKLVWDAPGCDSIVSVIGCNHSIGAIEITNQVYKQKVLEDENGRFAFSLKYPSASCVMDHPYGVMRPGKDQIPGSNVNFFCAQHWVFIGDESEGGMLWMSKDAPIFEFGEPHGQRWASDLKTRPWKTVFEPRSEIFSWVMNNVWFVNYKGYQEGRIDFRYRILPTGSFQKHMVDQEGLKYRQPLLVRQSNREGSKISIPFKIPNATSTRLTSIKPTRDLKGWSIRLFNASADTSACSLDWYRPYTRAYISDGTETMGTIIDLHHLELAPWEVITLIVE
jgi:alpha-mannosidase